MCAVAVSGGGAGLGLPWQTSPRRAPRPPVWNMCPSKAQTGLGVFTFLVRTREGCWEGVGSPASKWLWKG